MKMRSASWCVGLLVLIGTLATAEAAGPLTQVSNWMSLGSPARNVVIKDDLAYVTTDVGLKVVSLANPAQPVVLHTVSLGGRGLGLKLLGNHLYVANQSKDLQIISIDALNPTTVAPVLVKTKTLPGSSWDVALKDDRPSGPLIAYVASFNGEVYVVDVTNSANPITVKTLGILAWGSAAGDAGNLTKLNNHVVSGSGKVTGLDVVGNTLMVVEFAYGRFFYYDVANAANPTFAGTHYAPFTLRVAIKGATAVSLSAFGYTSGIYTVPVGILGPSFSTRHADCVEEVECGYFQSPPTDNGGLTISSNGHVVYIAGRVGEVRVLDVTNPAAIQSVGSHPIPNHYAGTGLTMGVAQYGNYIIAAGAKLGLAVFQFPGL
jgi:hypothetical protein